MVPNSLKGLFPPALIVICCFMPFLGFGQYSIPEIHKLESDSTFKRQILLGENGQVPIENIDSISIACISIGNDSLDTFKQYSNLYTSLEFYHLSDAATAEEMQEMWQALNSYDLILAGINPMEDSASSLEKTRVWLEVLAKQKSTICVVFENPVASKKWLRVPAVNFLLAYDVSKEAQAYAAQIVFGGKQAIGNKKFGFGPTQTAIGNTSEQTRLGYKILKYPNEIEAAFYTSIDSIVDEALGEEAFPGCQVLIAHKQEVVFQKAYGHHTYEQKKPVKLSDLYDLASVTKVSGPLPLLMQMHGEGKLELDVPFSAYWPAFKKKNKRDLQVRNILAHYARLHPYIVFWQKAVKKNGKFRSKSFSSLQSPKYPIQVSQNLFLHKDYVRKMDKAILKSPLLAEQEYRYSGLSFLIYPRMISQMQGKPYEELLYSNIYKSLGASRLLYNPLSTYSIDDIIPAEYDSLLRKQLVHGYVHDEAAAMFGGVSGNAGLFSNANDLAKLMQMYLNGGTYGGKRLIAEESIKEFTKYQFVQDSIPRGLGFDKNRFDGDGTSYIYGGASPSSYGHSGFTGTVVWMDPEHELLVVFLSNRVYPTRENGKLVSLKVRARIQEMAYKYLLN